jgi:hypothetical protein
MRDRGSGGEGRGHQSQWKRGTLRRNCTLKVYSRKRRKRRRFNQLTGEGTTGPKVEAQSASEITAAAQREQNAPHPATDTIEAQPTQTLADQDTILELTYPLQTHTLSFSAIHTIHAVEPTEQACPVCTEIRPLISSTRLSGCTHNTNICQQYLADWLTNSVGNTAVDRIACPSTNCSAIFTYADVQLFANPETFNRYDQLTLQNFLSHDPQFRYCLCSSCPFGQLHDSDDGNVFICNACGHRSCVNHNVEFHAGESCEQYDERRRWEQLPFAEQEALSREMLGRESVKCPGEGCAWNIVKSKGCDHITCKLLHILYPKRNR